jgi:hypothetical protein
MFEKNIVRLATDDQLLNVKKTFFYAVVKLECLSLIKHFSIVRFLLIDRSTLLYPKCKQLTLLLANIRITSKWSHKSNTLAYFLVHFLTMTPVTNTLKPFTVVILTASHYPHSPIFTSTAGAVCCSLVSGSKPFARKY